MIENLWGVSYRVETGVQANRQTTGQPVVSHSGGDEYAGIFSLSKIVFWHFQCGGLPTELPRRVAQLSTEPRSRLRRDMRMSSGPRTLVKEDSR